jgi:hypothetical protein
MGGGSSSTSSSEQSAQAYLAQNYSGSCNITCTNIQSGINIDLINTTLGGSIDLTQTCSVNANCLIGSVSDATSDVVFKATNSSNAKNAGSLFSGSLFNFDKAESLSRQDIKQSILQNTNEKCKLSSLNQMNDITILAANSTIGGNIAIGQTGSVAGQCKLQNNMTAAASATAMASNTATSGKDKKGQKKGGSAVLITIGLIIAALVIVYIGSKIYFNSVDQSSALAQTKEVETARGKAGCLGGAKPILDSKGKIVIDPISLRPVCPPPEIKPVSPVINVDVGSALAKK